MSKIVGYARVSTKGQNLDRQLAVLKRYVNEEMIVTDKCSGKDFERPGYQSLKVGIGKLVKGDTLYIKSLDRLGRNKEETKKELEYFKKIGVLVKVTDIPTTMADFPEGQEWVRDMVNNILIEVLASIAENERLTIRQRQREGVEQMEKIDGKRYSKKKENFVGRPSAQFPDNWKEVYETWKTGSITAVKAMKLVGMKKATFYNMVKRYEAKK